MLTFGLVAAPAARTTRFTALVSEGLCAVAAPEVANGIVDIALRHARLDEIPPDPFEAIRFVDGALRRSIEQILGLGAADTVVTQLVDLLARAAESGEHEVVRSRSVTPPDQRYDTPTVPAPGVEYEPSRPGSGPINRSITHRAVLVLTTDEAVIDAMVVALHRVAFVFGAANLAALQRRIRAAGDAVVVIDARPASSPSVRTVASSIPRTATLVVWGKGHESPGTADDPRAFISCDDTAEPCDVAALCANLLGRVA
jgi:hypothetical protein